MDDYVKTFLIQNNLEKFIDKFSDAGVCIKALPLLTECMLDELFEKKEVGFRLKFTNALKKLKNDEAFNAAYTVPDSSNIVVFDPSEIPKLPSIRSNGDKTINVEIIDERVPPQHSTFKSVRELLDCVKGDMIMKIFNTTNKIDYTMLTDLIVEYYVVRDNKYFLNKADFERFSSQIAEIFATDEEDKKILLKLLYVPTVTKNKKTVGPSGILYNKFHNFRKKLIACGLVKRTPEEKGGNADEISLWLQTNDSPKEEVVDNWRISFSSRESCVNIQNYFRLYKCLKTDYCHELLASDYDRIFPNTCNNFTENLNGVASILINQSKKKTQYHKDLIAKGKLDECALLLLPTLFPNIYRKRKAEEKDFGTKSEDVIQTFILQAKDEVELKKLQDHRVAKASSDITPYTAVVGDLLTDTYEVSLFINDRKCPIESKSLSEAVSYCYKSIYALRQSFPPECLPTYAFLKSYFFKDDAIFNQYTSVTKVEDEIRKQKKSLLCD